MHATTAGSRGPALDLPPVTGARCILHFEHGADIRTERGFRRTRGDAGVSARFHSHGILCSLKGQHTLLAQRVRAVSTHAASVLPGE